MRVKLGNRVYLCTVATHSENSKLILLTTSNGIYTVDMESVTAAMECHKLLLLNGYYDFSKYEYSN